MKNIKSINEYFDFASTGYIPNYRKGRIKVIFSEMPNIDDDFKTHPDFNAMYHHAMKHKNPAMEKFERKYGIRFAGANEAYPDYYDFIVEPGRELDTIKRLSKLDFVEDADLIEEKLETIEKIKEKIIAELEDIGEPYSMEKDEWNKRLDWMIKKLKDIKL